MTSRVSLSLAGAALLGAVIAAAAEEQITLTTYYPSPRGVYDELRARRYASFTQPEKYVLDMESGEAKLGSLSFVDEVSGRRYGLKVEDQRLLVTDQESGKSFVLMDLHQLEQ